MPSIGTSLGREAAVQGYLAWFDSAMGEKPRVVRYSNSVDIIWKPGQAAKMEAYFAKSLEPSKGGKQDPNGLNVSVQWGKVFIPLAVKKGLPWALGYTAILIFGTKFLWRT